MEGSASLIDQIGHVADPRRGEPVYPLVNILFMTICAVVAGAGDDVAIAKLPTQRKIGLRSFWTCPKEFLRTIA